MNKLELVRASSVTQDLNMLTPDCLRPVSVVILVVSALPGCAAGGSTPVQCQPPPLP